MRVEQICRTVQRHGGFAGTRSTLHHHGLVEVGGIMRSCSAWMVATISVILPVRLAFNRCEQRAFAGQSAVRRRLPTWSECTSSTSSSTPTTSRKAECDMAAHYDIAMIGRRRFVERTCRVGSPIGEDRLVVFVGQSDTPDVSVRTVDIVESANTRRSSTARSWVRRSSYMVAKESGCVRCVGDPCEPAARTVSRRARAWARRSSKRPYARLTACCLSRNWRITRHLQSLPHKT